MMFTPQPFDKITIGTKVYTFSEHPNAPGVAYGQAGRQSIVWQLTDMENNKYALKVYHDLYRSQEIEKRAAILARYSSIPGLRSSSQTVITTKNNQEIIKKYPDFEYSTLMTWIDGNTWYDTMISNRHFSLAKSRKAAASLAKVLASLEQRGLSHCDICSPNVFINFDALEDNLISNSQLIELVDFDQFYGSDLSHPLSVPLGSPGYNHKSQVNGVWAANVDRFAGAVMLLEMLIFHDDRARLVSNTENYFLRREMQINGNQFRLAMQILREQGDILFADLFQRTWFSTKLDECPTLSEWFDVLQKSLLIPIYEVKKYPVCEAKLIFAGESSVGKTSLVKRVVRGDFDPYENKTEGISINRWQINFKPIVRLNLWDFGGQEIMHATHQFFLTKRSLYVLVIDARNSQEQNHVEYWLKIIQSFGGESPVLIVGNKIDQHPLDIDRTGLQKKYPNIVGILETSAATGAGIEELKAAITEQVNNLPHVHDLLPETWFNVKTKLEELGHEKNYISQEKYLDLCAENEVTDETSQRTLIGFLHDLGVVLHFQDDSRLEALGILNPQWVTNGVYKILNSHTLFQNKGVLTVSMLDEILNLPEYPRGKRLFIVDMMKKFELCYDIGGDTFLVPDLLPKDEPYTGEWNGALVFKYSYAVLPSSIMSRFIVKMKDFVHQPSTWRSGTILKKDSNTAFIKADFEDRTVTIKVQGSSNTRRDTLSFIRGAFEMIHKSVAKLDVTQQVPHLQYPNLILDYEELIEFEREDVEEFPRKVDGKVIKVNVREMLNGIEREGQRKEKTVINYSYYGDINTGGGDFTGRDKSASASDGAILVGKEVIGNIVSGDDNQIIQDSYNKINSAEIDSELKDTLLQLGGAVDVMIQKLPAEQVAEVAEDFGKLADEAVKPKPNKKWYSVSIEGLIKAAEGLDKLGTPVISLSRKILSLLTGGVVK
jgi:small GTP-binding protein